MIIHFISICTNVKDEVDTLEFSRLVLDGKNISFEELPCKDQELSFKILQCKLKENIYIETFNQDTLKTLNLYDNINGYNNAAGLLADKNHFSGIDIVKFGENISIIQKRVTFEHISVLEIYEKALAVFRDYYQYEVIQGADRKMVEKIPEAAFREAIANALIHRVWDINSHIRVSMFDDRIEVVSPGGLPAGITAEEYLSGKLSILRNRNLANVFYRLGLVEIFGTGITRIKQLYAESLIKPEFEVSENADVYKRQPVDTEGLDYIRITDCDHWCVGMRPDDPLAEKEFIKKEDLIGKPLILPERMNVQSELANWFGKDFSKLQIAFTSNLGTNAGVMAANGLGYPISIEGAAKYWREDILVQRRISPEITTSTVIAWRRNIPYSLAVRKMIEEINAFRA